MSGYRYKLTRSWISSQQPITAMNAGKPFDHVVWIMLNPSTADVVTDDPTIRRCIGFTTRFGATGLTVVNLYAARTTHPAVLHALKDPVGPDNDATLQGLTTMTA